MYAFFGIGAMFSPIVIGSLLDGDIFWARYYVAPLAISISLAVLGYFAFKGCESHSESEHTQSRYSFRTDSSQLALRRCRAD